MLLAQAERRICIVDRLARLLPDERDASRVTHLLPDILPGASSPSPAAADADDLDGCGSIRRSSWRGRLPDTAGDLCSQPTVSRWENAPSLRSTPPDGGDGRLYCASYARPPNVTLDIDDAVDVLHGHQHCRCSTPITTALFSCQSMSTTRRRAGRSPCCCVPGIHPHGDTRSPAPSHPPYPPAMATDTDHHPRRRPLRSPGGHGVVRREWTRLHL